MRKNILLLFGVLAAVSCVNKDYDITKPIDTSMNIGGQLEIPLTLKQDYSFNLNDILLPEGSQTDGILRKLADGSYMLVVEPEGGLSETYDFPAISVADFNKTVEYPEDTDFITPASGIDWPDSYKSQTLALDIPFNSSVSDIDAAVEAISEAGMDAKLEITLGTTVSGVQFKIKDSFTFTLPECMNVDETTLPSYAEVIEGTGLHNCIKINGDQNVTTKFTLNCGIDKFDFSGFELESAGVGKKMEISGASSVNGGIEFTGVSGVEAGSKFKLESAISISGIEISSLTFKATPTIECASQEITFGDIPEVFTDGSLEFDLDDIYFYVIADNGSPFDFSINAKIAAKSEDGTVTDEVSIDEEDGLVLEAKSENQIFCLSESGEGGASGVTAIGIGGLAGLVSPIPDKVCISDTKAYGKAPEGGNGYVTVSASENYPVNLSYRIEAPLSFSSLKMTRDESVDLDVDLGSDVGFDELYIKADFISTLPLAAKLTFTLADSDGNALSGVSLSYVDADGNPVKALELPAGSLGNPSTKELKLLVAADEGTHISALNKLKIHIEAESPEDGTATLNADQSLSISNITVGTESGIFIKGNKN